MTKKGETRYEEAMYGLGEQYEQDEQCEQDVQHEQNGQHEQDELERVFKPNLTITK
ncbi:hypothetical protein [Paenibacillus thiaminolyticus]|uniref:hypothetical protein n=1 Tax=Paenibacillus thiaminolyticus TaxID=49283 RepID=UPI001601EF1F|nr:hypothetical protein [Paenibacillus thiaminolyticus]